jgi:general secretion pathway protein K
MHNNRGIALLITISVTAILVTVALEYNRRARFAVISTAAMRNRMTMSYMASSGIQAAMAMLVKDKNDNNTDSLMDDWADPEKIAEVLEAIPFESGEITVTITDELGKIQVNALVNFPESRQFNEAQRQLWDRLLMHIGDEEKMQEDNAPPAIINSLKDWLDSDDDDAVTGLSGAESSYYEDLEPAYTPRNGPIPDLNELLLIKGITPELFHGGEERPGLAPYLTTHGMIPGAGTSFSYPGKININTAALPVLVAILPLESQDVAQVLNDFRQEMADGKDVTDISDSTWYKEIPGLSDVKLNTNLITTSSDVFRITSSATNNSVKLTVTVVVQRIKNSKTGKWTCKILSRQLA